MKISDSKPITPPKAETATRPSASDAQKGGAATSATFESIASAKASVSTPVSQPGQEWSALAKELGAAIRGGTLSPEQALETIVTKTMERRFGTATNPAFAQELRTIIIDILKKDPVFSDKLNHLKP